MEGISSNPSLGMVAPMVAFKRLQLRARRGLYFHHFADRAHFERDVDGGRGAHQHFLRMHRGLAESGLRNRDVILARRDVVEDVEPGRIALRGLRDCRWTYRSA